MLRTAVLAAAVVAAQVAPAAADDPASVVEDSRGPPGPDYFAPKTTGAVRVRRNLERCRADRLLIGGLIAGAGLSAAVGVYFHVDSKQIADDLAADSPTNSRWSDALAAAYDRGQRSGTIAIAAYALAGALAVGTLVAVWKTDPGSELVEARVVPTAAVIPGGGTLGAAWQW